MVPLFLFNDYKKNTNNLLFHLLHEWYFCGSYDIEHFFVINVVFYHLHDGLSDLSRGTAP